MAMILPKCLPRGAPEYNERVLYGRGAAQAYRGERTRPSAWFKLAPLFSAPCTATGALSLPLAGPIPSAVHIGQKVFTFCLFFASNSNAPASPALATAWENH